MDYTVGKYHQLQEWLIITYACKITLCKCLCVGYTSRTPLHDSGSFHDCQILFVIIWPHLICRQLNGGHLCLEWYILIVCILYQHKERSVIQCDTTKCSPACFDCPSMSQNMFIPHLCTLSSKRSTIAFSFLSACHLLIPCAAHRHLLSVALEKLK